MTYKFRINLTINYVFNLACGERGSAILESLSTSIREKGGEERTKESKSYIMKFGETNAWAIDSELYNLHIAVSFFYLLLSKEHLSSYCMQKQQF